MSIRFACPMCKTSYSVDDADAGKKSDCKKCGQRLQVPEPPRSRSTTVLGESLPPPNPAAMSRRNVPQSFSTPEEANQPVSMPSYLAVKSSRKHTFKGGPIIGVAALGLVVLLGGGIFVLKLVRSQKPVEAAEITKSTSVKRGTETPRSAPIKETEPKAAPRKTIEEEEDVPTAPTSSVPLRQTQTLDGEQVYQRLVSSSIFIITSNGAGTGFIVDKERRLAITNYHVVGRESDVAIIFPIYDGNGELVTDAGIYRRRSKEIAVRGQVMAREVSKDLALIQLDKIESKATAAPLAAKPAPTGSTLFSVGGSGVRENLLWRLTKGTVRGRAQRQQQAEFGLIDCMILESDAPLNHGDSGGPVMNDRGELVGVVSHGSAREHQVSGNIDVDEVRAFIAKHAKGK